MRSVTVTGLVKAEIKRFVGILIDNIDEGILTTSEDIEDFTADYLDELEV